MKNDPHTCNSAGMRIFALDPIFYVFVLFAAVLGTILASYRGGISYGRKSSNK